MSDPHARANPLAGNPLRTRADVQRAVLDLVHPLLPHFSPAYARVRLGSFAAVFPMADAELEGFARPLWGLAPLAAGGGAFSHWERWRLGLIAGSDPDHPEHWTFYQGTAQTMVEQAAIGLGLALAPKELFEPLPPAARERLVAWLSLINRYDPVPNNWQFFRVLVNLGLERVGAAVDHQAVERSLDLLDSFYLGDGWYQDGADGARDHYIGWAFHAYGLIYAALRPDDPRSERFRERARLFAPDFEAWFDPRGGVVPFGRSLTYRFAAAGFWAALAFADEEALPWGRIKGILLRHLRWWSRHPISDRDGVLSLGWTTTNPWMREVYNSAGSPYWAMKAFLCLAQPETHPFWTAEEEPLAPRTSAQAHPGMVLSRDATQSVALSGGHSARALFDQGPSKYGRLAYSSVFGFSTEASAWGRAVAGDSALILHEPHAPPRVRRDIQEHALKDDLLYSRWSPFEGVTVHSVLQARTPWHTRLHRVVTDRELQAIEAGFALGGTEAGPSGEVDETALCARAHGRAGVSEIHGLGGHAEAALQPLPANANLVSPFAIVPVLRTNLPAGTHDLACAVFATDRPPQEPAEPPGISGEARAWLEELAGDSAA